MDIVVFEVLVIRNWARLSCLVDGVSSKGGPCGAWLAAGDHGQVLTGSTKCGSSVVGLELGKAVQGSESWELKTREGSAGLLSG